MQLKGVEAYIIKGMEANLLIGKDTQLAWQLHTIRPDRKRYWKIGDSPHCIPGIQGPVPNEAFTAGWAPTSSLPNTMIHKPPVIRKPTSSKTRATKNHAKDKHLQWNTVAKYQLTILPQSIATIMAVSRGAPDEGIMYFEGVSLKRGSDSFIQVPDGLIELDADDCFQVKIANTTNQCIIV
jgi:hypothetical protein